MEDRRYTVHMLVNDPTFVEWAMGNSNGAEAEYWNRWVKQSEKNRRIALRAQKQITGVRFTPPRTPDLKKEWEKVYQDILSRKAGRSSWSPGIPDKSGRFLQVILKVAAMLLVGAFVGFAVYLYQDDQPVEKEIATKTVTTGYEEKKTLNLSDGSAIILAAGSKLSYKENWLDQPIRRVTLEGEAYFSITPGEKTGQPKFEVKTEDGTTSVWGTRFTVDTYGDGTQVVLEEGEVRVEVAHQQEQKSVTARMSPGEMATFQQNSLEIQLDNVNAAVYTSWITNELYFDETPFSVLLERIRRTYGKEVIVKDPAMLDMKLSGSVDFRSLQGLMDAVSEVMNVNIYRSDKTLTIEQKQ